MRGKAWRGGNRGRRYVQHVGSPEAGSGHVALPRRLCAAGGAGGRETDRDARGGDRPGDQLSPGDGAFCDPLQAAPRAADAGGGSSSSDNGSGSGRDAGKRSSPHTPPGYAPSAPRVNLSEIRRRAEHNRGRISKREIHEKRSQGCGGTFCAQLPFEGD